MNNVASFPGVNPQMQATAAIAVKAKCPGCGYGATFEAFSGLSDVAAVNQQTHVTIVAGIRVCPDQNCKTLLFFHRTTSTVHASTEPKFVLFPAEAVTFDKTNLPKPVLEAFDEALQCFQNGLHVAAALMVRKTIEEICHHLGFKGRNLEDRIEEFKQKVTLPVPLVESLNHLRLLGNDAAHVESRHFSEVGEKELDVSLTLVKELLKSLFQYQSLKDKLDALRKS